MHTEAELMLAVGRLEGKVDAILQMQRLHEEQIKNHEERLRELEHSRSFTMGMAAAIGAGGAAEAAAGGAAPGCQAGAQAQASIQARRLAAQPTTARPAARALVSGTPAGKGMRPGTAEDDAALIVAAGDGFGDRADEIGVVAAGVGVGAEIAHGVAGGQEHGFDGFFVGETGVVGTDGDGIGGHGD